MRFLLGGRVGQGRRDTERRGGGGELGEDAAPHRLEAAGPRGGGGGRGGGGPGGGAGPPAGGGGEAGGVGAGPGERGAARGGEAVLVEERTDDLRLVERGGRAGRRVGHEQPALVGRRVARCGYRPMPITAS